jgi:hypothetical protein
MNKKQKMIALVHIVVMLVATVSVWYYLDYLHGIEVRDEEAFYWGQEFVKSICFDYEIVYTFTDGPYARSVHLENRTAFLSLLEDENATYVYLYPNVRATFSELCRISFSDLMFTKYYIQFQDLIPP